jgi:hypothetical protein
VRILPAESLRFPEEGSSSQGKPGSKLRPKGVGDVQLVDIPVPPADRNKRRGDAEGYVITRMEECVQASRVLVREIRQAEPETRRGAGYDLRRDRAQAAKKSL